MATIGKATTGQSVTTLQVEAFMAAEPGGSPQVEKLSAAGHGHSEFVGYELAEAGEVDLGKTEVIVSAGRGVGPPENVTMIEALADLK